LALAVFLASLDQTIVSTALPAIASEFNGLNMIAWVATSYMLTSTAFQPLYGRFSDIFGRKNMMLFATIVFIGGSILCGAAQSMTMLIIFRALAGLGGGGLMSMVQIIVSDVVSLRDRGKYQGIIGAVFAISSVIGPLLGGVFTDHASWRWAFYINIPIGALTVVAVIFCLRLPAPEGSLIEKLKQVDYLGVLLLLGGVVCVLLSTNWGGNEYAWSDPLVISLYVVGGVLIIAFILVEVKVAKQPIISPHLFRHRNVSLAFAANFFIGIGFFGVIFYMPMWFQVVRGVSATNSGIKLLPMVLGIVVFSMGSGWGVSVTGAYRPFIIIGCAIMTIGIGMLSILKETSPEAMEIGFLLLAGAGIGLTMQTTLLAAQAAVPHKDIAATTACCSFFRTVGGVIGVAICGALFNNLVSTNLHANIPGITDEMVKAIQNSIYMIQNLEPTMRAQAIHSFVQSLNQIFIVCIPMTGVAFLLSLGMEHKKLRKGAKAPIVE
ncbi:drug resistance transporter, EmrB/QacA subfamily, partial [Thamnocephalis sphaerospora]